MLLESCLQTCMTYTIAECTVNNSWWWTGELSETCRVSFQNKFEKLVHLVGLLQRNVVYVSVCYRTAITNLQLHSEVSVFYNFKWLSDTWTRIVKWTSSETHILSCSSACLACTLFGYACILLPSLYFYNDDNGRFSWMSEGYKIPFSFFNFSVE
jgi:hypothetical protein